MIEEQELFDLKIEDKKLEQMLFKSHEKNIQHWNSEPFNLKDVDTNNLRYLAGRQLDDRLMRVGETPFIDNRIFASTRAILAYVNARVATPDVSPSSSDKKMIQFAQDFAKVMYQHGVDHKLDRKMKAATKNLVVRKRGFLKLRFDPNCGPFGEILVDSIDPADIVVGRESIYLHEPNRIDHKQKGTLEELGNMFPDSWNKIKDAFGIKRGVYTQTTKRVEWFESWFTYYEDNQRKEGLCWFIPGKLVMGKMQNPNWIYTGDYQKDKLTNISDYPIKPFVVLNYLNDGKSYIDETSIFDQSKPMQDLINKRGKQIWENADYSNGRWVADKNSMSDDDAKLFINKNPKTIALIDTKGRSIRDAITVEDPVMLPTWVSETLYDARNELDHIAGTPNIFRGQEQKDANTLGENRMIKEQAGALQDDLATAVDDAAGDYYNKLAQMMKVHYTEDHWFRVKGDDGKFDHIVISSGTIDGNTKVTVEAGSTLPSNKQALQAIVTEAARLNRIDNLSFWEGMVYNKLPDPETIVSRMLKEVNDPAGYKQDVDQEAFNRDADIDIEMLAHNKVPQDRDDYSQGYIEHFNQFLMSKKFTTLEPDAQRRITEFLAAISETAARTALLADTQVDDAAMSGMSEANVMDQEPSVTV